MGKTLPFKVMLVRSFKACTGNLAMLPAIVGHRAYYLICSAVLAAKRDCKHMYKTHMHIPHAHSVSPSLYVYSVLITLHTEPLPIRAALLTTPRPSIVHPLVLLFLFSMGHYVCCDG